jgi:hypothetical protein
VGAFFALAAGGLPLPRSDSPAGFLGATPGVLGRSTFKIGTRLPRKSDEAVLAPSQYFFETGDFGSPREVLALAVLVACSVLTSLRPACEPAYWVDAFADHIASKAVATACAFPAILSVMRFRPAMSRTGSAPTRDGLLNAKLIDCAACILKRRLARQASSHFYPS